MLPAVQVQHWLRSVLSERHLPLRLFFSVVIAHLASLQRDRLQHEGYVLWGHAAANVSNDTAVNGSCGPGGVRHGDPLSILYDTIQQDWSRQEAREEAPADPQPAEPAGHPSHMLTYLAAQLAGLCAAWLPSAANPWVVMPPSIWSVGSVFLACWCLCAAACGATRLWGASDHAPTTLAIHSGMFVLDAYAAMCSLYPFPSPGLRRYSLFACHASQLALLLLVFELEENPGRGLPYHEHVASLGILEFVRAILFPVACMALAGRSAVQLKMD